MKIKLLFIGFLCSLFSVAQTFTGTGGLIPDNAQQIEFPLSVSGLSPTELNGIFGLKQVCLNITHSYNSDLNVFLVAPNGVAINLFSGVGGSSANFTNTCLSQTATSSINSGAAPFTGTFKPQETLGNLNNGIQNPNGVWKLRILDTYPSDQGTLLNWNITFGSNAPTPFVLTSSNLPIVLINTNGLTIVDEPDIIANMKIIDNGPGNLNYVTDNTFNYNGKITIEYRGNYSQTLPQKPYKIETKDEDEENLDVSLLGMPAENDWALLANYNDKVFMRNQLAYDLFGQMGHYSAKTKHCEVVVNGSYMGVFLLSESIKRGNNRVDISKLTADENTGLDLTGGYIIKNDFWGGTEGWQLVNSPIDHPGIPVGLAYHYPKADDISMQQKAYIANFITTFETALYSANYTSPTLGYANFIDEESFIDYFIMNELTRNTDGFRKSAYFYKNKDGNSAVSKLFAGPVWDFDWAWKNIPGCSIFGVTDGSGWAHLINNCSPDVNSTGWFVRLLQDTNFQNHLRCRWETLRATTLSTAALFNYIDTTALYLNQAQSRHFNRWGNLGISTGAPEIEADPSTFPGQITQFKNWITTRIAWLDVNIPGDITTCNLSYMNQSKATFKLIPNPANHSVEVRVSNNEQLKKIDILDLTGKIIFSTPVLENNATISTSNFAEGIYFVRIETTSNSTILEKLIVVH